MSRVILGTDAPAGSGVQPLGILRMVSMLSSLGDVPAEIALLLRDRQHGAHARARLRTDREVGRAADFVFLDRAQHSAGKTLLDSVRLGDLPGVGMTIIDGIVRSQRSRNTPPAEKNPEHRDAVAEEPRWPLSSRRTAASHTREFRLELRDAGGLARPAQPATSAASKR